MTLSHVRTTEIWKNNNQESSPMHEKVIEKYFYCKKVHKYNSLYSYNNHRNKHVSYYVIKEKVSLSSVTF